MASESANLKIPFTKPSVQPNREYFLRVSFHLLKDKIWVNKGHEVAWQQFEMPFTVEKTFSKKRKMPSINLVESKAMVSIKGKDFELVFNKTEGWLKSYTSKQSNSKAPLKPQFWRPITDNDRLGGKTHKRLAIWKNAMESVQLEQFAIKALDKRSAVVTTTHSLAEGKAKVHISYTILGDGTLLVKNSFEVEGDLPMLPKYGMQWQLPARFDQMTYLGKGPHENYIDRSLSADVGLYKQSVSENYYAYIRPQESSNKTGIRWLSLTDKQEKGWLVAGLGNSSHLSMSAWRYTTEDIDEAVHTYDLKERPFITLNIDYRQMGVGGDNSWSLAALPHQEFRLPAKEYEYSFIIRPINKIPKFRPLLPKVQG